MAPYNIVTRRIYTATFHTFLLDRTVTLHRMTWFGQGPFTLLGQSQHKQLTLKTSTEGHGFTKVLPWEQ